MKYNILQSETKIKKRTEEETPTWRNGQDPTEINFLYWTSKITINKLSNLLSPSNNQLAERDGKVKITLCLQTSSRIKV